MKPDKELTMIGQGILIGMVYALGVFTFWTAWTLVLYFSIRPINTAPFVRMIGASGIAALITFLSIKFVSTLK